VAAKDQESKPEPSKPEPSKNQDLSAGELPAEKAAQPVPMAAVISGTAPETAPETAADSEETDVPTPSDEELAQALRLLTPATAHAEVSTSSQPSLVAAGPRWVAEPIALSREEAAISLEAEMFRTFAATATTLPAAVSGSDVRPVAITGVSAIAAAVESRLAEAELAASAKASSEQGAERDLSNQNLELRAAETSAAEAPAEVMAAISNAASPVFDEIAPETVAEEVAPEKPEAEQRNSAAEVPEEEPAVAAATFADAVGRDEVEATTQPTGESFGGTTAAVAEESQDTSSDAGGEESMGNVKSKSGKSNWHQIRTAPAGAAATSDASEPAEAPKAMAAAAAAEGSSSSSATDASTIAGIVDSVMADLRPKIVEEIAKRLAGK